MITEFTPLLSLGGGALIGLAAFLFLLMNGRIAGVSGIVAKKLPPYSDRSTWLQDIMFICGLALAPIFLQNAIELPVVQVLADNLVLLGIAGFFVGLGAVIANGCTSGHGVCGISLLSPRSIVATLVLMIVAALVVFVNRHFAGL